MANDSVGSLFIDVAARTATLDADVSKIKSLLGGVAQGARQAGDQGKGSFDGLSSALAGTATRFFGVYAIVSALIGEFKNVYTNIQNIPGVPKSTIDSVNQLKYDFYEVGNAANRATAGFMGALAADLDTLKWVGTGLLSGFDGAEAKMQASHARAAKFATMAFDTQMAQAQESLKAITDEGDGEEKLVAVRAHKVTVMREEAALLRQLASGGTVSSVDAAAHPMVAQLQSNFDVKGGMTVADAQASQLQAINLEIQAKTQLNRVDSQLTSARAALIVQMNKLEKTHSSASQRIPNETKMVREYWEEILQVSPALDSEGKSLGFTAEQKAKLIDLNQKLGRAEGQLAADTAKLKEPYLELANTFTGAFGKMSDVMAQFIVTGKASFGDFFKQLIETMISTMIKMSIINPIMNAVFGGITGYQSAPTLGVPHAAGGSVSSGTAYLVGENGPEMMVPGKSGTVIPAGATAWAMSGGGGGGDSYHFSYNIASGITRQDLMPILKGQEKSIIAAIADRSRRGGSYQSAFR